MGLFDTFLMKARPEVPWMMDGERALFKKMREGTTPSLSFFRIKKCGSELCQEDIPKSKEACSKNCYGDMLKKRLEKIKARKRKK